MRRGPRAEPRTGNAHDQRACSKENNTIVATIAVLALTSLLKRRSGQSPGGDTRFSISSNAMITFQSIHSAIAPYDSRSIRSGDRGPVEFAYT